LNNASQINTEYARSKGVDVVRVWLATLDTRTRGSHAGLDSKPENKAGGWNIGGDFATAPGGFGLVKNNVNCFIPETYVNPLVKPDKLYRRKYAGTIVNVETSKGLKFSCTPNHEILTIKGWVKACNLNESSKIVHCFKRKRFFNSVLNINNAKFMFDEIFNFWSIVFPKVRLPITKQDFHGDVGIDKDVDIVFVDGFLFFNYIKLVVKKIKYFFFIKSDMGEKFLFSFSHIYKSFVFFLFPSNFFVSFFGKGLSFFKGRILHSLKHSFAFIPWRKADSFKPSHYRGTGDIELLRKFFNRKSFTMEFCKVDIVNVGSFSGHIYNLESNISSYLIQGAKSVNNNYYAVAHNCRCTTIESVNGSKLTIRRGRNPVSGENELFDYKDFGTWAKEKGLVKNKFGEYIQKKA